ncbi:MAG: hypothetical protein DRI71_01730 [Bacteroidetes bacterium]|nr:MAG: hypothetical protein DRI71_01730 [Bacteroidota bacterium]
MLYRNKSLLIILAAVILIPFSGYSGTIDPKSDCPKKNNKQQEDSVSIYESENKVFNDTQAEEIPKSRPIITKVPAKTSSESFASNLDESDKGVEQDPNSAMSFNIIYYIIDKFKFTDPLE